MAIRYIIKVTYLEGPHAGHIYLLRKNGYTTDIDTKQDNDSDTYASFGMCQKACHIKYKNNEADYNLERRSNTGRIQKGKKGRSDSEFIYWRQMFEPVGVDTDTHEIMKEAYFTQEELEQLENAVRV